MLVESENMSHIMTICFWILKINNGLLICALFGNPKLSIWFLFVFSGESINGVSSYCYRWCKEFYYLFKQNGVLLQEVSIWQIPYAHAITTIGYRNKYAEDYCSNYYNNKNFKDAYAIPIEPLPCESTWVILEDVLSKTVLPLDVRKEQGRLSNYDKKKGFTEVKFKRSKITCSVGR